MRRNLFKVSILVCLFILSLSLSCYAAVDYSGIIESESDWIASLQTPTGAIRLSMGVSEQTIDGQVKRVTTIEPYFANWALIGLLDNPSERNLEVTKKWIQWYLDHLNMPDYNGLNGTVYVHYSDADNPNIDYPANRYDSTDSYAGTFLTLLKKYYEASGDSAIITSNKVKIELIAGAIIATQQADGLTFAKPDYSVKYLMDATEAYDGFACVEWIERNVLNDSVKEALYQEKKDLIYNGIQNNLWNSSENTYNWHLGALSQWQNLYPESGAQTFPIQCNVLSPNSERAKYLYNTMNEYFPDWPYNGFWASQAYTAALMGDKVRSDLFIDTVKSLYIDQGRSWPWRASEAGHIIKAARVNRDKYNIALGKVVTASSNSSGAANVNDGKLFNSWTGAVADNEWIQIDLGNQKKFNRIILKWNSDYASQYKILVSDDGINYTDAYITMLGDGATDDIILSATYTKRYVKLVFTQRSTLNGVNLKEAEVYYEAENYALQSNGAIVTSDSYYGSYTPEKSIDGNIGLISSRWVSGSSSNAHWLEVEFPQAKVINTIKFYGYRGFPLKSYKLQYKDGLNWKDIVNISGNTSVNREHIFSPVTTTEIRLYITDGTDSQARIYELEAYNNDAVVQNYDVVVYGGTSSGVIAAVAAAREGVSVALLEPRGNLGGMTSGGLGYVDIGKSYTVGGITDEFFRRIGLRYGQPSAYYKLEPHAAEEIFKQMATEANVEVFYNSRLMEGTGVVKAGQSIQKLILENGNEFTGKVFIDATYEGDLMAWSGVSYTVGRESTEQYGEAGAGVRKLYGSSISPYDNNGNLLPDLSTIPAGVLGNADNRVQAYNFRLCLTQDPAIKIAIPMPSGYNPLRYEMLLQSILNKPDIQLSDLVSIMPMPNGKTDFNNRGWHSTDLVNGSWNYTEGTYAEREIIWQDHINYVQGFFYFLGHDTRVPLQLRNEMLSWGLSSDEFTDNNYWPNQLYVREARRMVGDYVMIQTDAWENYKKPDTIGMGSYMMDTHFVSRFVSSEGDINLEGLLGAQPCRPYEIPYRSLTPKETECNNLITTVCMSASHVMYSSLRMEPVYMIMGHAAGMAAGMAVQDQTSVQDISITELQNNLLSSGQVLEYDDCGIYVKSDFSGIVVDDMDATFTGSWSTSSNATPYMESGGYKYAFNTQIQSSAVFTPNIQDTAAYDVYIVYAPGSNRASNTKVKVISEGSQQDFVVDMKSLPESGSYPFYRIGRFDFTAGTTGSVTISNENADGYVVADAVLFVPVSYPYPNKALQSMGASATADSFDGSYTADKAIDGDISSMSTRWLSDNQATPHWLRIDFPQITTVDSVKIYGYNGFPLVDYKVQYLNNTLWVDLVSVTGNSLTTMEHSFTKVNTNAIRLYITRTSDNRARVYEFEAYSKDIVNYAHQAPGVTISADSAYSSVYSANKANDGNISSSFWKSAETEADHWLVVNFGSVVPIDSVKTYGHYAYPIKDYKVQVNVNGNWIDLVNVKGNITSMREHIFPEVMTDKIRLYITKSKDGTARIYEIQAYKKNDL